MAKPLPTGPLNEQHYQTINQELARLSKLAADIELAKQGGIDCDEHDANCRYLQQKYAALKSAYFPNRP